MLCLQTTAVIEHSVRDFKDVFVSHMIIQYFAISLMFLLQSECLAMIVFSETSLCHVLILHNCS